MHLVSRIFLPTVSMLMAFHTTPIQGSAMDDFIALDVERELFLWSEGELNDRCGLFMPCGESLQCTPTGGDLSKVCLPRDCTTGVFDDEFVSKSPDIRDYATQIMLASGLFDRTESMFNSTTLARGRDNLDADFAKFFLKNDVRETLVATMMAQPLDLSNYIDQSGSCVAESAASTREASSSGVTGMGGIVLEVEAGEPC